MLRVAQNLPPEPIADTTEFLSTTQQPITLSQFRDYWKVSHRELAAITGAPLDTVKKWFRRDSRFRLHPSHEHLYRLTLTHFRWLKLRQQKSAH